MNTSPMTIPGNYELERREPHAKWLARLIGWMSVRHRSRASRLARLIVWLFVIDFIVAYGINPAFGIINIGELALPQIVRGGTLLLLTLVILKERSKIRQACKFSWRAYRYGLFALSLVTAAEFIRTGSLPLISLNAYLQVVYWLTFWVVVDLASKDRISAQYMAICWVVVISIAAFSVYYGVQNGDFANAYEDQGVTASAGIAGNPKGLPGQLMVACFLTLFLSRQKHRVFGSLTALMFLGSSFLTYARAGMTGAALALVWLIVWNLFFRARQQSLIWTWRFVALTACLAALYFGKVGVGGLEARWADVSDPVTGGSGRALLWAVAVDQYVHESRGLQISGIGYEGMLDMMDSRVGMAVATHDDLLDAITIGGIVGLSLAIVAGACFVGAWRACPLSSDAAAMVGAIFCVLLCQSLLTGQVFAPDTMVGYVLGISCVLGMSPVGSPNHVRLKRRLRTNRRLLLLFR